MGKKLFGFAESRFSLLWCMAILFSLLTTVPSSGSFRTATAGSTTVKVLVVAGGGGGGGQHRGGGGGAGGYRYNDMYTVVAGSYTVTVGAGGVGGGTGSQGGNSVFDTITSAGGGGGATSNSGGGGSGGSGGGGSGDGWSSNTGGSGNTPSTSPSQGNRGADGYAANPGGGGGGASVAGSGSSGGNGTANSISGSSVTYAGGGGGGTDGSGGSGGYGGGGAGGGNGQSGNNGATNTGGGGGGAGGSGGGGGTGGSGIVIIRYVTADFGNCTGGTKTTDGADTIHTFTSSGTFTVVTLSAPTVTTGSATNVTSNSATLNGTVNANGQSTTAWFNYGITSGSYTGTSTTQSVSGSSDTTVSIGISGLSSSTTYYYRIAAQSSTGTSYGSELSFTTSAAPIPTPSPTPTDTTAPSGSISINSGASYTNSTAVTLTLSATDAVGVVGYYTSTSSSTPTASASGWNSVTSTTSYTGSASFTLASGDETKTVYVWYKDAAGNVSSSSSDSITLDTTAPIVTITSPTSGDTYTTTSSPVSLSGSASDSTSGVSAVTWSNNKGGSGDASGTTYWTVSSVSLSSGDNVITVTAKDNAGNTSTDTLTVTYSAGSAPTVKTGSATNVTSTSATLTGTVNANGQSTTAWFDYGTVKGTYGNKSSTQSVSGSTDTTVSSTITGLTAGTTYYYRIAAQNNSGTSYGEEMSFYKSSAENPPTVETEAATDVTNTSATLNGKCNPNGLSTTAWFEYGTLSGTYNYQTSTQSVSGSSYTNVSATITGLTVGTKYYYRIAAKNSAGTSYGKEMSFYKSADTQTTPTPQTSPTPAPTPVPTTTATEKGVIVGTVADGTAGVGIGGAKITSDKGGYSATTGFNGTYTIVDVSAGDYTLTASADGYKPSSQAVTVYAGEASAADFVLTHESRGIIFGFVLDEHGGALEGVTVAITGQGNNQLQGTETDDDGYYEFRDLEAGGYTLTFEKSGYRTQTLDITLTSEESLEAEMITMELEVKGSIFGYVVDIYGNPIESVRLKLKGIKTKIKRHASSDADGFFEFRDLDADKYVIFASKKRYKKTKQTVSLDEGDEQEIQIEMRKSSSSRRVIPEAEE